MNPRFCKIIRRTENYLFFQQVDSDSIDMRPEEQGYRSYTEYKMIPIWEANVGTPFKRKIKNCCCTIYDSNNTYITRWYD